MKNRHILFLCLALCTTLTSFAQTFTDNGFNFNILSTNPNEVEVTGGNNNSSPLIIPSTATDADGTMYTVTTIGNSAYRNRANNGVVLPNTITTISFRAFRDNNGLTSVTLPASVTSVSGEAFSGGGLNEVIALGTTPASINNSSFGTRSNVDLTVPVGLEDTYVAANWTGFRTTNGIFPEFEVNGLSYNVTSFTSLEVEATGGTSIPTALVLPASVSFENQNLTVVGVTDDAFANTNITSITLPASITTIGANAFNAATLTQIEALSTTPATIAANSFGDRTNKDVTVPNGTENDYLAANWTGFESMNGIISSFEVNDLSYSVTSFTPLEIEVTGGVSLPVNIVLPETVTFQNEDFTLVSVADSAFQGANITTAIIASTIQNIGGNAFNTSTLTQVEALGTTPATIAENSFGNRENIALLIPENTETDYENAGWTGFFSVNGEGVAVGNTFSVGGIRYSVTSLSPNTVSAIDLSGSIPNGDLVFPEVLAVNGINFSITTIGASAFRNEGLNSVSFPSTLITIEFRAFRNNNFTTVTLPENVTTIATEAFFENANLTEVISNAIVPPSISNGTFGPRGGIDLIVPEGTEAAYVSANWTGFRTTNGNLVVGQRFDVGDLRYEVTSFNLSIVSVISRVTTTQSISIPSTVIDPINNTAFDVTTVESGAFQNTDITTAIIASTIQNIEANAFNTPTLTQVEALGTTPATIEENSFGDRESIALLIPENTENDYENAGWTGFFSVNGEGVAVGNTFSVGGVRYSITSLSPNIVSAIDRSGSIPNGDLVFPEVLVANGIPFSITTIGDSAFRSDNLTSVSFPSTLTTLEFRAFDGNNFTTVTLPENVTIIATQAFFDNDNLTEVISNAIVPPSITNGSFGPRGDIDLIVPEGTEVAYDSANWTGFRTINGIGPEFEVNGLTYRVISFTSLEAEVTGGTSIPTDLVLPEVVVFEDEDFTLVSVGNNAFQEAGLTSLVLPATIRKIGDFAFDQNSLTDVELPEGLETIGDRGFRFNSLSDITFPSTVVSIGQSAFGVNSLSTITALGMIPATIGSTTFGGDVSNKDLFVPEGTTQAYIDGGWTGFNSITEFTLAITVAPKVFLQGASLNPIAGEENLMRDSLRENGLLPITSPYGDGATVSPTVFDSTGANAIVDWVLVELREGPDNENTTVVNSTAALLQRDGDIVGLDGTSSITFTEEEGTYFIAIIHRNHIGILAAVPTALSSTVSTLDFTQNAAFAKGENLALTTLVNGNLAMIAGDADGSSQILNTDITEALALAGGGEAYATADADMNGFVLNSDIQLLVLANSGTVQQFE